MKLYAMLYGFRVIVGIIFGLSLMWIGTVIYAATHNATFEPQSVAAQPKPDRNNDNYVEIYCTIDQVSCDK